MPDTGFALRGVLQAVAGVGGEVRNATLHAESVCVAVRGKESQGDGARGEDVAFTQRNEYPADRCFCGLQKGYSADGVIDRHRTNLL